MKEKSIEIPKRKFRFDEFCEMIHQEFPRIPWKFIEVSVVSRLGPALHITYKEPYINQDDGFAVPKSYMSVAEILRTASRFHNFDPHTLWLGWILDELFLTTDEKHWRL